MRLSYKTIAILLIIVSATPAIAVETPAFANISWSPRSIKVGAPCLFKVAMASAPSSLKGKWQGRDLVFFSDGQRRVWYGLAGVDVEATPGTYKLELEATMPDGQVLRTVQAIQVRPSTYKTVKLTVPDRFVQPDAGEL